MNCSCGGVTKTLHRVHENSTYRWQVEQCEVCGREHRVCVKVPDNERFKPGDTWQPD